MAQPYVGEIRMFAGNFAPAGWAFCMGELLPISENETLFQLIGTTYGGDGESTFALPDLRGRVPIHQGNGFILAETGGVETITLTVSQIPAHSHPALGLRGAGNSRSPVGAVRSGSDIGTPYQTGAPDAALSASANTTTAVGGSQPHDNVQPFLCVSFIISLFGIFPSPT
jgi:microcystin-dependent protein